MNYYYDSVIDYADDQGNLDADIIHQLLDEHSTTYEQLEEDGFSGGSNAEAIMNWLGYGSLLHALTSPQSVILLFSCSAFILSSHSFKKLAAINKQNGTEDMCKNDIHPAVPSHSH